MERLVERADRMIPCPMQEEPRLRLKVNLVELSMQQKDALNVLLTGRAEGSFAEVIERIVKSRALKFDLIVLRPQVGPANQQFNDTMNYKQVFLADLLNTYTQADEIRLYEDRVKQYDWTIFPERDLSS